MPVPNRNLFVTSTGHDCFPNYCALETIFPIRNNVSIPIILQVFAYITNALRIIYEYELATHTTNIHQPTQQQSHTLLVLSDSFWRSRRLKRILRLPGLPGLPWVLLASLQLHQTTLTRGLCSWLALARIA